MRAALQNLSAQLIREYGLDDQAPGGLLPEWTQTPAGFESLLSRAADVAAARRRRLVIVVDGLDEAEASGEYMSFGLPLLLPTGVYPGPAASAGVLSEDVRVRDTYGSV